jgi:hypothetical protein
MTVVCIPYHAIAMTIADSSNGPSVHEAAREAVMAAGGHCCRS